MTLNDPLQRKRQLSKKLNPQKFQIYASFRCLPGIAENIHGVGYSTIICSYFTAECNSRMIQILVKKIISVKKGAFISR